MINLKHHGRTDRQTDDIMMPSTDHHVQYDKQKMELYK